ncbi:hypothetical protein [Salinibacter sp.]|uniref:hypothetical protein n=1 Tax=Salinibacter sp. TaxID=2065818 RepID=UPI0021E8F030|nr:hypothetical protein [Salinibacter sp.]
MDKETVRRKALNREYETKLDGDQLDGDQEARLFQLACSTTPEGRSQWSLRLLADRMVELNVIDTLSYKNTTNRQAPNRLKPHLNERWVIPSEQNARFVAKMEEALSVYRRPYKPARPVVCMDEMSRQLLKHVHQPTRMEPDLPRRHDYH